jgi:hypothetical protein
MPPDRPPPLSRRPRLGALCLAVALAAGCNDDDKKKDGESKAAGAAAGGVQLSGKDWSGTYYATDRAGRSSLKATITQTGDALVIVTSRPAGGSAHRFTGSVSSSGKIRLTDAVDGELWTTYFGPANSNYIKLADFRNTPVPGGDNDDFFILELSRKGAGRPANVKATAPNTTHNPKPTTPPPSTPTPPATPEPPPAPPAPPPTPPTPPAPPPSTP